MLDDYVTKCGFTLVSCPNTCKVKGEVSLGDKERTR